MTLPDVPSGARVYVDANIFMLHFAGQSDDCSRFLERVERGEVEGVTGPVSVLEVAHRLMMLEALERGFPVRSNPAARLAWQPQLAKELSKYYFSARGLARMGVEILTLPRGRVPGIQRFGPADIWSSADPSRPQEIPEDPLNDGGSLAD